MEVHACIHGSETCTVAAGVVPVHGSSAIFGESGGSAIFLDDVVCSGGESSLLACGHNEIGKHDCTLAQTAGVICGGNVLALNTC
jgi:hypothetical protein